MVRLPCVKCGSTDHKKPIKRRKRNGKWSYVRKKTCIICIREESKAQYEKTKKDPVKWENYKKSCAKSYYKNRNKAIARVKKYYKKNSVEINLKRKLSKDKNNMYLQEVV